MSQSRGFTLGHDVQVAPWNCVAESICHCPGFEVSQWVCNKSVIWCGILPSPNQFWSWLQRGEEDPSTPFYGILHEFTNLP